MEPMGYAMDYIRKRYNIPAKRGGRVKFQGKEGVIIGAKGAYLRIRIDGGWSGVITRRRRLSMVVLLFPEEKGVI